MRPAFERPNGSVNALRTAGHDHIHIQVLRVDVIHHAMAADVGVAQVKVQHHQVKGAAAQVVNGLLAAGGAGQFKAPVFEQFGQAAEQPWFVVHQQHASGRGGGQLKRALPRRKAE